MGRPQAPFPAGLTCPCQHVLNILRCPGHTAGLVCILQPQDEGPSMLLGKDVVVQRGAEATQVQEACEETRRRRELLVSAAGPTVPVTERPTEHQRPGNGDHHPISRASAQSDCHRGGQGR